jgi:multidrug efflux system outer membrane protein
MGGCMDTSREELVRPSVAPLIQPKASLDVDASQIQPMYEHRMLAVDLPTVIGVAMARNIDIQEAMQHVEASRGDLDANVAMVFPSFTPNITTLGIQGALSNVSNLALAAFSHTYPAAVLQWVINPGLVAYDIVASKRRLEASEHQDQATVLETTRLGAVQYYDLVLGQAKVTVAQRALKEAEELLRIERLKVKAGTALPADELRAEAALAQRRLNLLTALNAFYNASVALTVTLQLEPTVMLAPKAGAMQQTALVREDLPIDEMLVIAVRYRPDLQAVRTLLEAAEADKGATIWGGLGPQLQATRVYAPPPPATGYPPAGAALTKDTMYRQPKYQATGGFNWSLATFGRIRSAAANVNVASLEVDRQLEQVQAVVVTTHQAVLVAKKAVPIAKQQVTSAEEALRLTQKNLLAGTGLLVEVLQAQDAADQARLQYATTFVQYNQSQVNLLAALGLIDQTNMLPERERNRTSARN